MHQRCSNKNRPDYKNYGGRGIKVCSEWKIFEQFCSDVGDKPEGKSLDRKDNNGPYSKENCKWSTRLEQNTNSRQCKLTEEIVKSIRRESRKRPGGRGGVGPGLTLNQIAAKYGISYRNTRAILDNESWQLT